MRKVNIARRTSPTGAIFRPTSYEGRNSGTLLKELWLLWPRSIEKYWFSATYSTSALQKQRKYSA